MGEIAYFRNGKGLNTEFYTVDGKYPVWGSNGKIARTDKLLNEESVVVIGRVGAYCGSVYAVNEPNWITDNAIIATPKDGVDLNYLYYRLNSLGLIRVAVGSAQPLVTQGGLKVLDTVLPPLPEQKAIARILGSLDDKIELNRQMNRTLEDMAQAIFKAWFVDSNTSEEIIRLLELIDLKKESIKPEEFPNEIFDHFSLPAFDEREMPVEEQGSAIKSNKYTVYKNSTLISKLNPRIPRIWLPDLHKEKRAICSTEFLVSNPTEISNQTFIYGLLKSDYFQSKFQIMVMGTSGSHQRVKPNDYREMKIFKPDFDLIRKYEIKVKPLLDRILKNKNEIESLTKTRDTLLPKLVSGEIGVN